MVERGPGNKLGGRPESIDLGEFEDCFDQHQWWHYQSMAENAKQYAAQSEVENGKREEHKTVAAPIVVA